MAIRRVLTTGSEVLTKNCKKVQNFDEALWQLLDDMYETMVEYDGIGIAAPQVGVIKRAVVIEVNNIKMELINPEITDRKGSEEGIEGCLSVKNIQGYVNRPKTITVKAFDRYGNPYTLTCTGMMARCICHECDHLDGILFTDIMTAIYQPKKK